MYQKPQEVAVLGRDDPGAWALNSRLVGRLNSYGFERPTAGLVGTYLEQKDEPTLMWSDGKNAMALMPRACVHLRGDHNLQNVLAACAVSAAAGMPPRAMRAAVESFYGCLLYTSPSPRDS